MPIAYDTATTALPELLLYVSLNCPYSALANYRASWLQATMRARVDVRLVCRPEDETTREVDGDLRRQLHDDVQAVRGMLVEGPVFPLRVPPHLPDVREATRRYAHDHTRGTRAHDRRVRLFRGLWLRGADLAEHSVLDDLGVPRPADPETADAWQRAWRDLDQPAVPVLATPNLVLGGAEALHELLALRTVPASATAGH